MTSSSRGTVPAAAGEAPRGMCRLGMVHTRTVRSSLLLANTPGTSGCLRTSTHQHISRIELASPSLHGGEVCSPQHGEDFGCVSLECEDRVGARGPLQVEHADQAVLTRCKEKTVSCEFNPASSDE